MSQLYANQYFAAKKKTKRSLIKRCRPRAIAAMRYRERFCRDFRYFDDHVAARRRSFIKHSNRLDSQYFFRWIYLYVEPCDVS